MPVHAYYSTDPEAPVLTGQVGTLVNLLKKCLVDGYGNVGQGTWKDPAGWVGLYDSVYQKAGFHSVAAGSPGHWLYVDDMGSDPTDGAGVAEFRGYEGFSGFDGADLPVGQSHPFPLETTGSVCAKSDALDGTARGWALFGDDRLFYLVVEPRPTWTGHYVWYVFGDIVSLRPADGYHTLVVCSDFGSTPLQNTAPSNINEFKYMGGPLSAQTGHYLARAFTQLGDPVACGKMGDNAVSTYWGFGGYAFPTGPDDALHLAPVRIVESGFQRGGLPGVYQALHARPLSQWETITGVDGLTGRTLQAVPIVTSGTSPGAQYVGQVIVDLTGPWR